MNGERKSNWKCHICKPRNKSASNNIYEVISHDEGGQQKQQRDKEGEDTENENSKRFKDSISLNELQTSVGVVKYDVSEVKTQVNETRSEISGVKKDIHELKDSVEKLAINIHQSNISFKDEMKAVLSQITNSLSDLSQQMAEIRVESKQNKEELKEMDIKMNKMQQQIISKKIEIKNVNNDELNANDVVKTIASSINVQINEHDISDAYRLKNIKDKIIIEFTTHNKKREFMKNIKRHRIDASIINNDSNNSFIYINDCLTAQNRKLLWLAKTKAKEVNWKFVWSRNGAIFARKTENAPVILINNSADIELIA